MQVTLQQIFEANGGAIAIDTWTDDFKRVMYIGITCHYIKENKNDLVLNDRILCVRALDIDEKKTGDYILTEVKKILAEFSLSQAFYSKKIMFITDRGKNLISAFNNVNDRLNCFAHLLNNVCQHSCKLKTPLAILEPIRKTVRYIKFKGLNNKLSSSLKSHVKTRFNTNGMMLDSVYANWDDLTDILVKENEMHRLQDIEQSDIKRLIDFLNIFSDATKDVERTKSPSLYKVWIWIIQIKNHLKTTQNDNRMIRIMKTTASRYLDENFTFHPYYKVAVFLNPLYKGLQKFCSNDEEKEEIYSTVRNMIVIDDVEITNTNELHVDNSNNSDENSKASDLFVDDDIGINHNIDANTIIETELNAYRSATVKKDNFDLLSWWAKHKTMFPNLFKIAMYIHSIPATSAGAERSFSLASNHITDKRSNLKPSTVDAMVFLNNNRDYLENALQMI